MSRSRQDTDDGGYLWEHVLGLGGVCGGDGGRINANLPEVL